MKKIARKEEEGGRKEGHWKTLQKKKRRILKLIRKEEETGKINMFNKINKREKEEGREGREGQDKAERIKERQ